MILYEDAIKRVQRKMQERPTPTQARESLKSCGILDSNYKVVGAYKDIVVKLDGKQVKNERK